MIYYLFIFKTQDFEELVNDGIHFIKSFQVCFPDYHSSKRKLEILFILSASHRLFRSLQFLGLTFILADIDKLTVFDFFILIYLELSFSIIFAQFFLGILFIWHYCSKIRTQIEILESGPFIDYNLKLEQMRNFFGKLYEVHTKLRSFYGVVMLFMLLDIFQSMVITVYYDFLLIFDFLYDLLEASIYTPLIGSIFVLLLIYIELYQYCVVSSLCHQEV